MSPSTLPRHRCATAITAALLAAAPALAGNYYVSTCGNDAWTGTNSFCIAPDGPKRTIQAAIDAADDGDEIRVTAGTYSGPIALDGKAVRLLGLAGRNLTTIDGNGTGPVVHCADGEGPDTIIEGFTITGGHAVGGSGGGVLCYGSSPTIEDCVFDGNVADLAGGGLYIVGGSPVVSHFLFTGNVAGESGGGVAVFGGSPVIGPGTFGVNRADVGGGLHNGGGAETTVFGCSFVDNEAAGATAFGGGVANQASDLAISASTFLRNLARLGAAVASATADEILSVSTTTFTENEAAEEGGAIHLAVGDAVVQSSLFEDNAATLHGGDIVATARGEIDVRDCSFTNATAGESGGSIRLFGVATRVTIERSSFEGCRTTNAGVGGGGAIGQYRGLLFVSASTFSNNETANNGGALHAALGLTEIFDSVIEGNTASTGGGVYAADADRVTIAGCLLEGNVADGGGALYDQTGDDTRIINCTVVDNTANLGGAILGSGDTRVVNSIVRDNGALAIFGTGDPVISYCNVEGGTPGVGNIDVDPDFLNPGTGNYRLSNISACVDAGVNHAVPADRPDLDGDGNVIERLPHDLDGNPRFADAAADDTGCGGAALVDMGAYEAAGAPAGDVLVGDINADGVVEFNDLVAVLSVWGPCDGCCPADLDFSGLVDFGDLLVILDNWSD